ncbi:MAG TPA: hypothetical protein VFZ65_03865 [Planctomycetota bacterium]|nr:hypothetical protein [Planctomycetota bacterium]
MKKLQTLLLSSSLIALTACAGQTYRADVGAMFPVVGGDIALQNSAGTGSLGGSQNDLKSEMGLGDSEVSPYVRLQMDDGKSRFRVHGFGIDAEGSGTLVGDFGDIAAGSVVKTSMEYFNVTAAWGYEVLRNKSYRVAVGAQLGFYLLDIAAVSAAGRESVDTTVLVPMPFAEAEWLWKDFAIGANGGFMSADLGDAAGIYWDLEGYVRWQAAEQFDVLVGYRNIRMDAYGSASSRDFDADLDIQGIFISGGVRF